MPTPLTIAFATRSVPMHGRTPWERCLGGSESALVFAARALARRGHIVEVYTRCDQPGDYDDVTYHDIAQLPADARVRDWDVFISLRFPDLIMQDVRASLRLLWCQDVLGPDVPVPGWLAWCDALVFVSEWHRATTVSRFPVLEGATEVVPNSVDLALVPAEEQRQNLLVHLSRPERGLRPLLLAWPSILARAPGAQLAVARYRSFHEPAGSQTEAFCLRMDAQVTSTAGAEHVGNLSKPELYALLSRAALMVYPAEFDETSCIAAIEAQACGLPVVAVRRGALPETLCPEAAALVEPGPDLVPRFADAVVDLLHDPARRAAMSAAARAWVARFDHLEVAQAWERTFQARVEARSARRATAVARTLRERGDSEFGGGSPIFRQGRWRCRGGGRSLCGQRWGRASPAGLSRLALP